MIKSLAALRSNLSLDLAEHASHFADDDPRRAQPLSLERQRKRAEDLLRSWKSAVDPARRASTLRDAQQAIAKEHGFVTWQQLKAHIELSNAARKALRSGVSEAPDGSERALHIRCGTDIQHALAIAGFSGDFLPFYDPYVHGPVPLTDSLDEFLGIRAEYLSNSFHKNLDEIIDDLREQYTALEHASRYDAVNLWLEHDSYDQLILAKLLDYFSADEHRPGRLMLISVTHYPGVKIFNGIGQLPPEAMRVLWAEFKDVSAEQLALGQSAWSAISSPTSDALRSLIATGTPELPTMAIALERHLKQLPSERNGLNLSENLTLQILDEKGDMVASRLFGWYTNHYEPLTFMGDTGYWQLLDDLSHSAHPAIRLDKMGRRPSEWHVSLRETGRRLLADEVDWVDLNGIDQWVGGIHLSSRNQNVFRHAE